jgi:hypothetical protein
MTTIDATYQLAQHIVVKGDLVGTQRVVDKMGKHMLVLSQSAGPSPSQPSDREEYHELKVILREVDTNRPVTYIANIWTRCGRASS